MAAFTASAALFSGPLFENDLPPLMILFCQIEALFFQLISVPNLFAYSGISFERDHNRHRLGIQLCKRLRVQLLFKTR